MRQGRNRLTRLCIIVLALIAVCGVVFAGAATPAETVQSPICYNHGDVNADGVIDSRDAVHTLYHYLFGEEEYPVDQDWDFNSDESLDSRDAIYVLCAYNFQGDPNYQLDGIVHNYYDPIWQWDETTAVATFKCGCGQTVTLDQTQGVIVEPGTFTDATCVTAGSAEYIAQVELNGKVYSSAKVTAIPARSGGHEMVDGGCTAESYCVNCDYRVAPSGHKWGIAAELSNEAGCTADAAMGYRCTRCQETQVLVQEGTAGHLYEYFQDVSMGNCLFVKQYKCARCEEVVDGTASSDIYYVHSYKATLTSEASCSREGVKTYTCTECSDSYTVTVEKNASHSWNDGVVEAGVTTYTCNDCGETKTAVSVAADEAVSKEALSAAQEVQLSNDTAMSMDESVVENLDADRQILITVDTINLDDVAAGGKLTEEEKAQIGDNAVYDFNMVYADNNDKVDFEGTITVSLPYTLQPGEDIDSIDVWYIADDGTLERVDGTYSNGFVTFTTDHFSYYTVTRLTASQRCERYGHIPVVSQKSPSCTEDGYTMSVCQRCGTELEKTVHKRTGHLVTVKQTAATCETDGSSVQTCRYCKETFTRILPALGHDMVLDAAASTDATCNEAGMKYYTCKNCPQSREEVVAQLEHDYIENERVLPTCDSKGVLTKTCQLCYEEVVVEEEAPLGHDFSEKSAVWSWSDDQSSATVTLYCMHDSTHTKVLNAVITETILSSSCTQGGGVSYTASASCNNVTYTDSITITGPASGHIAGSAWESNGNEHYHVCTACGELIDTAKHNWDDGSVLQAPTCAESGKMLFKCTVCAYQKEQIIPATGDHAFADGICSVCGYDKNSCDHLIMKDIPIDLSGYNICQGTEMYYTSCACGQKRYLNLASEGCSFGEPTITKETAADGTMLQVATVICSKCGLTGRVTYGTTLNKEDCVTSAYEHLILSMGEAVIGQHEYVHMEEQHACGIEKERIQLTTDEHGVCGITLSVRTCYCGAKMQTYEEENQCSWTFNGGKDDENGYVEYYICGSCGATRTEHFCDVPGEASCEVLHVVTTEYFVKDVKVYEFTNTNTSKAHTFETLKYELQGALCTDGIVIEEYCTVCGEVSKDYYTYHRVVNREKIDLTGEDICYDAIIRNTCACEMAQGGFAYQGNYCQWRHTGYISETRTDIYECSVCGATKQVSYHESEKNENCQIIFSEENVFFDKNGKILATVSNARQEERHDYENIFEMYGESCLDGYKVTRTCRDCGDHHSYEERGHVVMELGLHDLTEFGMCGGWIYEYGCACGAEHWQDRNEYCNWRFVNGAEYTETFMCNTCGTTRVEHWDLLDQVDTCHVKRKEGAEYYKDDALILDVTYERVTDWHDYDYVYTLFEGAQSCEDGVRVNATCKNCGAINEWTYYHHESYVASEETFGEGVLCAPIRVVHETCPCGYVDNTHMVRGENSCEFYGGFWSEENNGWTYTCSKCGSIRIDEHYEEKVEGTTCDYLVTNREIYKSSEGEDIYTYESTGRGTNHKYVYTFNMMGTTCDEGYYLQRNCVECGYTYDSPELRYGCSWFTLSSEKVYENDAICGPIYAVTRGCGCGARYEESFDYECRFVGLGYDSELNLYMQKCTSCELMHSNIQSETRIPGTCDVQVEAWSGYYLNNEWVAERTSKYTSQEHNYVHTFQLYGETCDDGYSLTGTCTYCGITYSDEGHSGHSHWLLSYYDLAQYGLCDGYISEHGCACGDRRNYNSSIRCDWNSTGKVDPATGAEERYCAACDSYWYRLQEETVDSAACMRTGTTRYWWVKNGETVLDLTVSTKEEYHRHVMVGAEFDNPDAGCTGGYTVTMQCQNCDDYYTEWCNDHRYFEKQYIDLADMGACGGWLVLTGCPCGKNADIDQSWDCSMSYDHEYEGNNNNGQSTDIGTCERCGLQAKTVDTWKVPEGACIGENTRVVTITMGDWVETLSYTDARETHMYVMTDAVFDTEVIDCESGYTAFMTCQRCGEGYSYHNYYHNTEVVQYIDLGALGACDGYYEVRKCACGKSSHMNYDRDCEFETQSENTGDSYNGTRHEVNTCKTCGLQVIVDSSWSKPDDHCTGKVYYTYTFVLGDQTQSLSTSNNRTWHDYRYTYELKPGSVTCEDGLYAYATCVYCGNGYTSYSDGHSGNLIDSIDLTTYGSVCGGTLDHYVCPCGQNAFYQFSEDLNCDLDNKYIDHWIEGVVDDNQETADGYLSTYSYAYLYTCAVTDPACSLKIRMADYWLVENCIATRYQTWQLGYDELTGACQEEITIATGERHAYHNYEITAINEIDEDGVNTFGNQFVCVDCGSTYYYKNIYKDGYEIRYEERAENTLNAGENRSRYFYRNYDIINGFSYEKDERIEYVRLDGSVYWQEQVYTYDFASGCIKNVVSQDSEGEKNSYTTDAHRTVYREEILKEATCTQHGERLNQWSCIGCGVITNSYVDQLSPNAHYWQWDSYNEIYRCYYCQLENVNGASGSIVMEDLTDSHGGDQNYVVGYWNRGDVEFNPYVSVILDNADSENNELVLTGIDFIFMTVEANGVRAVAFDAALARELAAAAVETNGYTGDYAIRITFVPMNGDDTLDYAVTFNSVTAQ